MVFMSQHFNFMPVNFMYFEM